MSNQFNTVQAEQDLREEAEAEVIKANEIVTLLDDTEETPNEFSNFVYDLDVMSGGGVDITQFSFNREEGDLKSIGLIGQAADRVSLSNFRDALEDDDRFLSADLPISNLAKDSDITFSMTIVLNKEE